MKNRWISMALVLSLAMNAAVAVVAGYNYYGSRSRLSTVVDQAHDMEHHFYEVLGLSANQLKKMRPLADSFHNHLKNLHTEMSGKNDMMINLLGGKDASLAQIETLRLEMAAIQDTIQQTVIAHVLDVKEILDSSQRERFFDLLRGSMTQKHCIFGGAGE